MKKDFKKGKNYDHYDDFDKPKQNLKKRKPHQSLKNDIESGIEEFYNRRNNR